MISKELSHPVDMPAKPEPVPQRRELPTIPGVPLRRVGEPPVQVPEKLNPDEDESPFQVPLTPQREDEPEAPILVPA